MSTSQLVYFKVHNESCLSYYYFDDTLGEFIKPYVLMLITHWEPNQKFPMLEQYKVAPSH